jgi:hypothetical protein
MIGVMAQEVEQVFPQLVKETNLVSKGVGLPQQANHQTTMESKAVNYDGLVPVLLEAIKEQQKQIEILNQKVELLQKKQ